MMRRAILIAACIGITCFVTNVFPAAAYFYDGNRLLTACQSLIRKPDKHTAVDVFNSGLCVGFITGVADALSHDLCLPRNVSIEQLEDIVVRYLRYNPKTRHLSASSLVFAVLTEKFPCN